VGVPTLNVAVTGGALTALQPEQRVNMTTADVQGTFGSTGKAIAHDANGNYVVVWTSNLQDGSSYGIFARRFDASGNALTGEVLANILTTGAQVSPAISINDTGDIVIVWNDYPPAGNARVVARTFDSNLLATNAELIVSNSAFVATAPSVALRNDGSFAVSYTSALQDGNSDGIYLRNYDNIGHSIGNEFLVNSTTLGDQRDSELAIDGLGHLIVVWSDATKGTQARIFDSNNAPLSAEIDISSSTRERGNPAVTGLKGGGFVVVWQDTDSPVGDFGGIKARVFNAQVVAMTSDIIVNVTNADVQYQPDVIADTFGNFTVSWTSTSQDGASDGIYMRRFNANGLAMDSTETLVNSTTLGTQSYGAIEQLPDGHFVVVWSGQGVNDIDGVYQRHLYASTDENGGAVIITTSFTAPPSTTVNIPIALSSPTEGTLGVSSLSFNSSNWNLPQTFLVTGETDGIYDANKPYSIYLGANNTLEIVNINTDLPHTITVDTTSDVLDADTSSISALLANRGADGRISLREAILAANASANATQPDNILFNIADPLVNGAHTINLTSLLPAITDAVNIDATSEPDYVNHPIIELTTASAVQQGIVISASDSTVKGLALNKFSVAAITVNSGAANALLIANYIGTDVTGLLSASNLGWGIDVTNVGARTMVGDDSSANRNIIASNGAGAIRVLNSRDVRIGSNYIGIGSDGATALGNTIGISLFGDTLGTVIRFNHIANSSAQGIALIGASANATILTNLIFNNGGLGIDLGGDGVTPNDTADADIGANNLQNYPVLQLVTANGPVTSLKGSFNSAPSSTYLLQFFMSATGNASGFGEAGTLVGSLTVTTDAAGNANFDQSLSGTFTNIGWAVSATATQDFGGGIYGVTSEFSRSILATSSPPTVIVSAISNNVSESGTTATFSISLSVAPTANVSINLNPSVAGEVSLSASTLTFTTSNWNTPQTVTVTGLQDFVSDGSISLSIVTATAVSADLNYSGLDPADIAIVNQAINNVAPLIFAPANVSASEDTPLAISGFNFSDSDASVTALFKANLTTHNGVISLTRTTGLSFSVGDGAADSQIEFTGTLADITAAIDGIQFLPTANYFGAADITISLDDLGNSGLGGAAMVTTILAIDVASVNDAPTIDALVGGNFANTSSNGQVIARVLASDLDSSTAQFSLVNNTQGLFAINANTGEISLVNASLLQSAVNTNYSVLVRVQDEFGAITEKSFSLSALTVPPIILPPTTTSTTWTTSTTNTTSAVADTTTLDNSSLTTELSSRIASISDGLTATGGVTNILQNSDVVQSFDNTIKESFTSSTANAIGAAAAPSEPVRIGFGRANATKGFRSADLASSLSTTVISRQFDSTRNNKQSLELLLFDSSGEMIKRRSYSGSSLTQLMESWHIAQKDYSIKLAKVALFNVNLPDAVHVGSVSLQDIDKSLESKRHEALVDGLEFAGLAISAGMVAWVARVGGLVAALITALPAWKSLDPLLLLATEQEENAVRGEDRYDTEIRIDEEAVEAVLS
jgi:hypothetical protein